MKVAIEKQTVDADGNVITETMPCEDSEKAQKRLAKDHFVPPKPTAFAMFNHFRANVPYANIDGALHLYSSQDGYYRPVNQQGLEEFLLEQYYGKQSGFIEGLKIGLRLYEELG